MFSRSAAPPASTGQFADRATQAWSAKKATIRVPRDELAKATKRAGKRIKARPMAFTKRQAGKVVDQSLGELSRKGKAATSKLRGTVKGGATVPDWEPASGRSVNRPFAKGDLRGALRPDPRS